DDRKVAPADFRYLLAHADNAFGPVQEGMRVAALDRGIDMLKAIRPTADHRHGWFSVLREAAVRLVRPLHRRTRAITFGQRQILAHTDFVAVADDRRPRQRE